MNFTEDQQQSIDNLDKFTRYFKIHSKGSYEQEAFVANNIIDYIKSRQTFTHEDTLIIESLYNQIKDKEHANGSGWFDFQIHLGSFLYRFGFDANSNNKDEKLTITKISDQNIKTKAWWKLC